MRSRCLGIRVPAPTHEEVANVLVAVAKKEQCACPQDLAMKISLHSDRNLRRALLMLEAAKVRVETCPGRAYSPHVHATLHSTRPFPLF